MIITSPHNERVKLVRALQHHAKTRRQERRIALEGVRLVGDALAAGARPDFVLYTAEAVEVGKPGASLLATLQTADVPALEVTPALMAHAADTQTPQGVIAVLPMPEVPLPDAITLMLILDGVADPGNLGTILRAAAAAGADGVWLAPGGVDPYNPKALRSGMGAHFRVPIIMAGWPGIATACAGLAVYIADADGARTHDAVDWCAPSAVIIGGEAHGTADAAGSLARERIAIPMANAAESLNAAIAAAVLLFEARRQRSQAAK
jgi:TrmH family RNA methyltransferase